MKAVVVSKRELRLLSQFKSPPYYQANHFNSAQLKYFSSKYFIFNYCQAETDNENYTKTKHIQDSKTACLSHVAKEIKRLSFSMSHF